MILPLYIDILKASPEEKLEAGEALAKYDNLNTTAEKQRF